MACVQGAPGTRSSADGSLAQAPDIRTGLGIGGSRPEGASMPLHLVSENFDLSHVRFHQQK